MESAYATIEIGGTLRRADIDELVAAATEDYCQVSYTESDGEGAIHNEISAAHNEKRSIQLFGEDVPYAEFDALEALCIKLGLPFKRCSDPIFDAGKTLRFWKPGLDAPLDFETTDGDVALTVAKIRSLIAEGELADTLEELDEIDRFKFPLVLEGSMADEPTA